MWRAVISSSTRPSKAATRRARRVPEPPTRPARVSRLLLRLTHSQPPSPLVLQFYGPSVTTVSKLVQPWLRLYIDALSLEIADKEGEFYLFHVSRNLEKNMGSSQWCSTVKAIFKEFSPTKVSPAPKNLRAR